MDYEREKNRRIASAISGLKADERSSLWQDQNEDQNVKECVGLIDGYL